MKNSTLIGLLYGEFVFVFSCIDVKRVQKANLVIRTLHLCNVYLFLMGYSAMTGASRLGGSLSSVHSRL